MMTEDLRELDRRAVHTTVAIAAHVTLDHLARPTPCSEWTVGELLEHMTAQHRGFAASARGHGDDLALWQPHRPGPHTRDDYLASAKDVLAAFEPPEILDRPFAMPEFGTSVPGHLAVGMHLVDYVVHGWDLARALGIDYELDDELAEPTLRLAAMVPDGPQRSQPDSLFGAALPSSDEDQALQRLLRMLGRSPNWPDIPAATTGSGRVGVDSAG
ncbi:TIGR03086 family metal-binding protein [Nocardia brevicatena]|uniref:TIGR03086 family metal-binding protein n=1 Tax=Nocardia brevicatena TaxID=37327 RepID=UPI0002EE5BAA|nr:TIGR03086 family metal-binding protein [Nocardia brevicatena]